MPAIGSVVDFWKNNGTISTAPPIATTIRISTIIRKLLVSIFSWLKPVLLLLPAALESVGVVMAWLSFFLRALRRGPGPAAARRRVPSCR
jgi:hypothetical protein